MPRPFLAGAVVLAAAFAGWWLWWAAPSPAEREIRHRLDEFAATFNRAPRDGIGGLAQAAHVGQFFTTDVAVDLGRGSPPLHGRDTLIGMVSRLHGRAAEFELRLVDVTVIDVQDTLAEVSLTAVLRSRPGSGADSLDAREFSVRLQKVHGGWQVSHVTAVDALR